MDTESQYYFNQYWKINNKPYYVTTIDELDRSSQIIEKAKSVARRFFAKPTT